MASHVDAANALAADGYQIVEGAPPGIAEAAGAWSQLVAPDTRRIWPQLEPIVAPGGKRFVEIMFQLVPPIGLDQYAELFSTRQRLGRAWSEYQTATPLVLAPISASRPFHPGADVESPAATGAIVNALRATVVVNFLGLPSVAVPVGLVNDLPQAVQIIGPRFAEGTCLRAAEIVEAVTPSITPIDPRPLNYSGDHPR